MPPARADAVDLTPNEVAALAEVPPRTARKAIEEGVLRPRVARLPAFGRERRQALGADAVVTMAALREIDMPLPVETKRRIAERATGATATAGSSATRKFSAAPRSSGEHGSLCIPCSAGWKGAKRSMRSRRKITTCPAKHSRPPSSTLAPTRLRERRPGKLTGQLPIRGALTLDLARLGPKIRQAAGRALRSGAAPAAVHGARSREALHRRGYQDHRRILDTTFAHLRRSQKRDLPLPLREGVGGGVLAPEGVNESI
jgi:hypothetical protein